MTHFWAHLSFTLFFAAAMTGVFRVLHERKKQTADDAGSGLGGDRQQVLTGGGSLALASLLVVSVAGGWAIGTLPVGHTDLAGYLVAYSGELSFSMLFYMSILVASTAPIIGSKVASRDWEPARGFWAITGLGLYATTLSGRGFDIYETGYGHGLAWVGLVVAAIAHVGGRRLIAVWALGVVLSWQLRLSNSVNFWDYAVDPFLFFGSFAHICVGTGACLLRMAKEGLGTKSALERKLLRAESGEVPANALGHALTSTSNGTCKTSFTAFR